MKKKVIALILAILMITVSMPVNIFAGVYIAPSDIIEIDKSKEKSLFSSPIKATVKEIPEDLKGTRQKESLIFPSFFPLPYFISA